MTADQIIEGILGKEGGYVNNPNDKGGPTRWGITQT
ncbi:glycosyl hydrolase 108 family protein, partial [Klebsiella michiganensis]